MLPMRIPPNIQLLLTVYIPKAAVISGGIYPWKPGGLFLAFRNIGTTANPNPPSAGSVIMNGTGIKPFGSSIKKRLKSKLPSNVSFNIDLAGPGFLAVSICAEVFKEINRRMSKQYLDNLGFICQYFKTLPVFRR